MVNKNSRNFSYPSQIGILLALVGVGILVGAIVSAFIWKGMTGRPLLSMGTDMMDPKYYWPIMWMQVVSTLCMLFLPAYFLAVICYRDPFRYLGFKVGFSTPQLITVVIILLFTFPLSGALAELTKMIQIPKNWEIYFKAKEAERAAQEAALININSFSRYAISMVIIALLPAIFEELFFRGGLQNILMRWFKGPWIAIILTSIIFSAIHMSYYGFLVRFVLGVILGLVFYYSGSLWLSCIFHFLYNGFQVTALYIASSHGLQQSKDIEENFPMWAGLIALVIILYGFIHFRKISLNRAKLKIPPDDPNDIHDWIAHS